MSEQSNKTLFVINPVSGGIDKQEFKNVLKNWAADNAVEIELMETTGQNDPQRISQKVKDMQPAAVVACGGDGTINMLGKELLGTNIPLGLIPMGSANGLATEFEIPPEEWPALEIINGGKTVDTDLLCINGEHYCFHLSDVGFNAKLIRNYEDEGGHGKLLYAKHLAGQLTEKDTFTCTIETERETLEKEAVMVVFANATKYGTGAVINPLGAIDDGKFEICIYKPFPNWSLPRLSYLLFTGRIKEYEHAEFISTPRAKIKLNTAQPVQIDGEIMGEMDEVTVEIISGKLRVLVP